MRTSGGLGGRYIVGGGAATTDMFVLLNQLSRVMVWWIRYFLGQEPSLSSTI